jgi:hypothetical protein
MAEARGPSRADAPRNAAVEFSVAKWEERFLGVNTPEELTLAE